MLLLVKNVTPMRETNGSHGCQRRVPSGPPRFPLADVYARFLPAQMLSDLLSLIRAWSPDVLVWDPMEFAGCIAAECLGIPHTACGPLFVFWQEAWHDTAGEVPKP
jgi:hypothetical protein